MSQVIRRPLAEDDLLGTFVWYARKAGMRVADRFLDEAEATFNRLAGLPRLGTIYDSQEPLHAELRYIPVSRYRDYLVFYRPIPDGIEVFRVLHGARDIPGLLTEEGEIAGDDAVD